MSLNPKPSLNNLDNSGRIPPQRRYGNKPVVLLVGDNEESCFDMKHRLQENGYHVIETDNGKDAEKHAMQLRPDLLLVDLDVPLLYELVAARQIVKNAQTGSVPIVIVTRDETSDPYPMMEVGVRRNEFVTRISDSEQLGHLLDFLLPIGPDAA